MTEYQPNMVLATKTYNVVGTRPIRHDGADKVTGAAKYGADFNPAIVLYGKVLRSPHAHAAIRSIDTSAAEALPGVKAVVTNRDFHTKPDESDSKVDLGESVASLKFMRDNVLASDKALYKGHAVAGVAAESPNIAEEALSLIKVDYEPMPAVLTAPAGAEGDASLLHRGLKTQEMGVAHDDASNVAKKFRHSLGDVAKGFAEADIVIEREFNTQTVHQGYIEPHATVAFWNRDGRLTIWLSTQAPFEVRSTIAQMLEIPVSQIRVVPLEIGGGFGGKIPVYLEPVAALLSRKAGTPVKLVMSRQEVFEGTGPTPGSYMKLKMGATKDGRIVAGQAYLAYEAGAYPGSPVDAGAACLFACYDIPNVEIEGLDVVVNKPKTAAYRAPGATNAAFAAETIVDEIAETLGMDSMEFRLKNTSKIGTRRADGPTHVSMGMPEVMEAMRDHPHWKAPLGGPNRGRGAAVGFWFNIGMASSCSISVSADGKVNLVEGNPDIGGTRASIAMQAAEVLGLRAEDVNPTVVDTDLIGYTALTAGSRTTFATGWAAYQAAHEVKRQMIARAASIWEVDADTVELKDGTFSSIVDPELQMSFKDLAGRLNSTGGPIMGSATIDPKGVGGSASGCIVDVEVDPETHKVDIVRVTAFQDAGKAVHPSYVEGQMQGGTVQGIGWGLNEEYFYTDDGQMANGTFLDYRMPTSLDLPMIDTVIIEVHNPGHPYGVRGVGEASIIPPPAALANAIYAATGLRMETLPMSPNAIFEARGGE